MTIELTPDHRYTVISADAHAGGDIPDYRPYLASSWHDEFDSWAASYVNPYADLLAPTAYRSWDSDRRLAENEADGIVAEVIFPNTVPPVLRGGQSARPAPHRGRLRPPVGRAPGPQPVARRLLRQGAGPAGRGGPDLRQRHRRRGGRGAVGGRAHPSVRRDPPAPHRPGLGAARPVGGLLRAAVGGLRGARHGGQHPRRRRPARLRRRRGGPRHHAGRAPLVLAPLGLAPHLRGRVGAPSVAAGRADRAGAGVAAARASRRSTGSTAG